MDPKDAIQKALAKSLEVQRPLAKDNVDRLRRVHPNESPSEMKRRLDRYFLRGVTTSGGAAGAAALVPGAGVPSALADVLLFTEASVLYVLSLAEIHGLHPEDIERRKALVLTVMLGDTGTSGVSKLVEHSGAHWAKHIVSSIPMSAINKINKALGPRFVTKYGTKQGVLVLGKQVPMGIGAAIGGGGNYLVGRATVASARRIFGDPPEDWAAVGVNNTTPWPTPADAGVGVAITGRASARPIAAPPGSNGTS